MTEKELRRINEAYMLANPRGEVELKQWAEEFENEGIKVSSIQVETNRGNLFLDLNENEKEHIISFVKRSLVSRIENVNKHKKVFEALKVDFPSD